MVDPKLVAALQKADAAGDHMAAQAIAAKIAQQRQSPAVVATPEAASQPTPEVATEPSMPDWQKRTRAGMKRLAGAAEVVPTMASGMVAAPVSGIVGLIGGGTQMLPGDQSGRAARWQQGTQEALTYEPKTETGKGMIEAISKPFEALERGADYVGERSGRPEQALGATAVKTALMAAPMALGLRGPKAPAKSPAAKPAKPPTTAELKGTAQKAYKAAEDSGVIISKDKFGQFVDDLQKKLTDEAIDKDLTPKAKRALDRLMERKGENFSMKGVEVERRAIKAAEKSIDPADRRMAGIIRREFDDFMDSLDAKDVIAGDPKAATSALKTARDAWTKAKKSEVIEGLVSKAKTDASQFSGSGYENALRTRFRQLARNDKKMRMFSKTEQSAIRKVAEGGPLENSMRALGKFAPRGIVSTTLAGGAGYALGGPVGSAAVMGAGELGRLGATKLTSRNARLAEEMMRRGGPAPKAQPTLPVPNKRSMALAAELAVEGQR